MRFMTTQVHGVIDYVVGVLLILAPWLFAFSANAAATWTAVLIGAAIILYSLFTDYELGVVPSIPMPTHLWLDGLAGAILALSPWLFGFADVVWVPHLILGLVELGGAFITETVPSSDRYFGGRPTAMR